MTLIHSGTAQAGASKSITLAASASEVADFYKYRVVKIVGGTGVGQVRNVAGSAKNLLKRSLDFSQLWTGNLGVKTFVDPPFGSVLAPHYAWVATAYPQMGQASLPVVAGQPYVMSCWFKHDVAGVPFALVSNNGFLPINKSLFSTGAWQFHTASGVATATGNANFLLVGNNSGQQTSSGCAVYAAQLCKVLTEYIHTEANPAVGAIIDTAWDTIPDATSQYEIHEYLIAAMAFALKKRSATMTFSARSASFAMTKRTITFRKVP